MKPDDASGKNGPARGASFSVVAPAVGVCVFLAVLAAARCDDLGAGAPHDRPEAVEDVPDDPR